MAEALLRHLAADRGIDTLEVSSAGTASWDGAPASEGSYLVCLEHGLDLSGHRARQVTTDLVADADLILGMNGSHVARAEALGGEGKAFLLGEYAGATEDRAEVDDPFGGDLDDYRETYARLLGLLEAALPRLDDDAHRRPD